MYPNAEDAPPPRAVAWSPHGVPAPDATNAPAQAWPAPPGGPALPPSPPEVDVRTAGRSRSRTVPLLVAGAVVLGLAVGGGIALARSGSTPQPVAQNAAAVTSRADPGAASVSTPTSVDSPSTASAPSTPAPDPAAQASALDGLLTASAGARSGVQPAINDIENCASTSADISALQNAASVRQQLTTQLQSTDLSALPDGAAMVAALEQAWAASIASDGEFIGWAGDTAGCFDTATHDNANYSSAMGHSAAATAAKEQFVALWNPVAAQYGLSARQASGI